MIINLDTPVVKQQSVSQATVDYFTDTPSQKVVYAVVSLGDLGQRSLLLWEGDAYDAIGQWTDTDAQNRIKELLAVS